MKKTNTKKSAPAKKSPAIAAKASIAKKVSTPKKTITKVSQKSPAVTQPVVAKKSPAKKVAAPKTPVTKVSAPAKKIAVKKPVVQKKDSVVTKIEHTSKPESTNDSKEGVKMLGILHLVGNLLSGGTLGIILVVAYLLIKKDSLSAVEKATCYEIINFNLSFIVYMWIAVLLIALIIGLVLIPVVGLTWFVLLILWFLSHLIGDNYRYPLTIRFIS